ncbi:hypothetical protein SCOCK_490062 [Actinacidiphila cocklensis]|uniref:Uncharacterized protein n=1 Tax=Actinacidiphila cocklensis TaxID=887465 RepID=A0A9W4DVI3_9ACTN|nr:hypothetical protein SCOCK_490062 [Actinacidiphila cocklensis]
MLVELVEHPARFIVAGRLLAIPHG